MKTNSIVKFLVVTLFAISLAACGGGGSGADGVGDAGSGGGEGSSAVSGIESSIIGTWVSVCQFIEGPQPYIKTTVTFQSGGQETDTTLWYMDSGCSSATGLKKVTQNTYSIGNNVTASGKSAYEINVTTSSWALTQDGSTVLTGGSAPTQYGLIALEGDRLYFDDNADLVTSESNRPTTLGLENYYTRQ